jgi:hypothetical protein
MLRSIKLYGVVDSVEEKKLVLGGHLNTIEKLRNIDHGISPIMESNKFCVKHSNDCDNILPGDKVLVWAQVKKYRFASKFQHNFGEQIIGWSLILKKIEKHPW